MRQFSFDDISQIEFCSRVAIVTGGNEGIGKVTTRELVRKGWNVIIASRNEEKAHKAIVDIKNELKMSDVALDYLELDLSSNLSVRQFVSRFHQRQLPLHLLINNAGLMTSEFQLSSEGEELQFATNYLGHFLLTNLLLNDLRVSIPSRVVFVSSHAHKLTSNFDFDSNERNQPFPTSSIGRLKAAVRCYMKSKLAMVMMCNELTDRLGPQSKVYCNSLHPGLIKTSIWSAHKKSSLFLWPFMRSVENGALTTLYVATHSDIEEKNYRARYFIPSRILPAPFCRPVSGKMNRIAQNRDQCRRLWHLSEELTKFQTKLE